MRRIGLSLCLLVMAVVGLQSCNASADGSLASLAGNECAGHTDGLKGDINKDVPKARAIARQIDVVISQGKSTTQKDGKKVRLIPTCKSRKLDKGDLDDGRFIGVLTGEGTSPLFSVTSDDIVYWWVYGEKTKTPEGKDTVIHHSQFLSLNESSSTSVMKYPFIVCHKKDSKELKVDTVGWQSSHTCSATHAMEPLHGHHPWFGCKLGCCFSTMPES